MKAFAIVAFLVAQILAPAASAQTKPAVTLEGAFAKEQVDSGVKRAMAVYLKIALDTCAPPKVRANALLHLAGCYEKLGQQAQSV